MAMAARILMPTETHILTLSQWLSPAFPVGAFAYSHGLEGAVDQGWVTDGDSLEQWLTDVLYEGAGRADALLLAAAYKAQSAAEIQQVDDTARALSASKERLLETHAQGLAFGKAVLAYDIQADSLTYPVALGVAARQADLPLPLSQKMYIQAFLSNLIAAGQRLLPVGQQEALGLLTRLTDCCVEVAENTAHGDLGDLSSIAFMTDIASMKHETQYSRIFRT